MKIEISTTPKVEPDELDLTALLRKELPLLGDVRLADLAATLERAYADDEEVIAGSRDVCIVVRCSDTELQRFIEDESVNYDTFVSRLRTAAVEVIPTCLEDFRENNLRSNQ